MLLIFDLDDTLIDSFGCSQPIKWKLALKEMVKAGLQVKDFDQAYNLLIKINEASKNGKEALEKFLEELHSKEYYQVGVKAYYGGEQFDFPIDPLEGAVKVLKELSKKHDLILISHGVEEEQYGKMKKAGLDQNFFKKIIITNEYNKRKHYEKVVREFGYLPSEGLVIGDKVDTDLLPAKELGLKTVRMLWGRSKNGFVKKGEVDYVIRDLREILNIVRELES
ncbi:MAG: HAD family hydrolase [Nanoarchaeota archaeon]|nr:HAD family hydrolase [Nanoarchaeota archaeon]MBU1644623.1 HAD family hydrolase [Nanoarchaeota archaeon]MBU1977031.1 HAD family hydrolase [Nanoarchaeota archaeon]